MIIEINIVNPQSNQVKFNLVVGHMTYELLSNTVKELDYTAGPSSLKWTSENSGFYFVHPNLEHYAERCLTYLLFNIRAV